MNTSPVVFISYSWKCDDYIDQIRSLAEKLRSNGIDVILDQWDLKPGYDKFVFMEKSIEKADKVLIMCDESYAEKANNRRGGVGVETTIITPEVYDRFNQEKFIPVIMDGQEYMPIYLRNRIGIDFRETRKEKGYEELVRVIYNKPEKSKPELGPTPGWLGDSSKDVSSITGIEDEVLSILKHKSVSSAEIAEITGKSIYTVRRVLKNMKASDLIKPVGRKYAINNNYPQ
ncbi:TIR domain-containing protein [Eubacterium pyruvativorans]|uniref:TIR domain-containing protein n=1 Tax=Eubacterium pyruvativorans TaxID=155865 RepID=UPI003F894CAA